MTGEQFAAFALELGGTFRGTFGPQDEGDTAGAAQLQAYLRQLGSLDFETAMAAIALLVQQGQVFIPQPAEIVMAVQTLTRQVPGTLHETLAVFDRSVARRRRGRLHAQDGATWREITRQVVADVQARCGEGAARWVAARGVRELCEEDRNGEYSGAVMDRLGKEYALYLERAAEDGRVGVALARVGARAEIAAGREPRRLDAARALGGAGRPELTA